MLRCWKKNPDERPRFLEIVPDLAKRWAPEERSAALSLLQDSSSADVNKANPDFVAVTQSYRGMTNQRDSSYLQPMTTPAGDDHPGENSLPMAASNNPEDNGEIVTIEMDTRRQSYLEILGDDEGDDTAKVLGDDDDGVSGKDPDGASEGYINQDVIKFRVNTSFM